MMWKLSKSGYGHRQRVEVLQRLEVLMKFPKKFARLTSSLTVDDNYTYRKLLKLLHALFCENCQSVTSQNGLVIVEEVKKGARVRSNDKGKKKVIGEVVGVGFKRAKLEECVENENNFQTDAFCVRKGYGSIEYCNSSSGWMYDCI